MKNIILLLSLIALPINSFSQTISKIEPENWWVGMKYNTITLLVYGNNISDLQPSIFYPDVQIIKKDTVENKNYLFATFKISLSAKPGNIEMDFSKKGGVLVTKSFPIFAREKNSADRESFSQKDVIYLVVPDRFSDGDMSNDVVPELMEKDIDRNTAKHYLWSDNCDSWVLEDTIGLSIKQESMPSERYKRKITFSYHAQQFFFILKGTATFYLGDNKIIIEKQKGILIQPKTKHFIASETNEKLDFLVVSQPATNNDRTIID